jgi:hypothetical protein
LYPFFETTYLTKPILQRAGIITFEYKYNLFKGYNSRVEKQIVLKDKDYFNDIAFMINLDLYWLFHFVGNKGLQSSWKFKISKDRKCRFIYFVLEYENETLNYVS